MLLMYYVVLNIYIAMWVVDIKFQIFKFKTILNAQYIFNSVNAFILNILGINGITP